MLDIKKIRDDFPVLKRKVHDKQLVYLDNAASTLKPQAVIDAITHHYTNDTANVHRGIHYLSEYGTALFEQSRERVRKFINAGFAHEIIFTKGTTDSINLVAQSFGEKFFAPGDKILLSTMEHHSNIVPWQLIAEKTGAKVVEIPIDDAGDIIIEKYHELLDEKVKMVAIAHISNTLGTVNPIKELIKSAHAVGAKFLVDAAQSVAHEHVDVQDMDCDFLAFSSHKIFGPTGVGVLYGKENLLDQMPPYQGGGSMIDNVTFEKTTYHDLPNKFEAGTPHIAGVICLAPALDYVANLGMDNILQYEHELLHYATERVKEIEGLKIIGTAKNKTTVLSFDMPGIHPQDIGTILDQMGIAVRTGHHCTQPLMRRYGLSATTRASFCIYNTKEEVDLLVAGLYKVKEFL